MIDNETQDLLGSFDHPMSASIGGYFAAFAIALPTSPPEQFLRLRDIERVIAPMANMERISSPEPLIGVNKVLAKAEAKRERIRRRNLDLAARKDNKPRATN